MRIERRAEWNDEINDWTLPNMEFTGNNIKIQKAKRKEDKEEAMKASLPAFKALLLVRDCMEASSEAARTFALHMLSCPARKDWRREAKSAAYFFHRNGALQQP